MSGYDCWKHRSSALPACAWSALRRGNQDETTCGLTRNAPEPTVGCFTSIFPIEQLTARLAARGRIPALRPFPRATPSAAAAPSGAARPRSSDRGRLPAAGRGTRRPSATARPRTTPAARRRPQPADQVGEGRVWASTHPRRRPHLTSLPGRA